MTIKACFFDLDGTLLNTLQDLADSLNGVLARNGYPEHPLEDFPPFIGDGVKLLVKRALPEDIANNPSQLQKHVDEYLVVYGSGKHNSTAPYPGVISLVKELQKRDILLAVVTNKPHNRALEAVEKFFPNLFEKIVGQKEGVPVKPDPTAALEVMEEWDLSPDEVLFIGDSGVDMQLAVAVGFLPVAVEWGYRTNEELRVAGAEVFISNAENILGLLS